MEQNKKQTAIDWLIEKINSHDSHDAVILSAKYFNESKLLKYLQVAKQLEKEQIIDARHNGIISAMKGYAVSNEQYYNDTYGKE